MPTLLLTNDDGIDAPGLQVLKRAVLSLPNMAVVVVAPRGPVSGCGHQTTMAEIIAFDVRDERTIAVAGTPVDCVRLALHGAIFADASGVRAPASLSPAAVVAGELPRPRFAAVLSGVNAGANLGVDVFRSGTVAAAREAALHGLPAVAFSQYRRPGGDWAWQEAERLLASVLQDLLGRPSAPPGFWNVNLPNPEEGAPVPHMQHCKLDRTPWPLLYESREGGVVHRGRLADRPRVPGTDTAVCFAGNIAACWIES